MIEADPQTVSEKSFNPAILVQIIMDPPALKNYIETDVENILNELPPIPQPWEGTPQDEQLFELADNVYYIWDKLGDKINEYFYDPHHKKTPINRLGKVRREFIKESLSLFGVTRQKAFEMMVMLQPHSKILKKSYEESADERVQKLYNSVKHIPYGLALVFLPDLTDFESDILFRMSRDEVVERAVPTL